MQGQRSPEILTAVIHLFILIGLLMLLSSLARSLRQLNKSFEGSRHQGFVWKLGCVQEMEANHWNLSSSGWSQDHLTTSLAQLPQHVQDDGGGGYEGPFCVECQGWKYPAGFEMFWNGNFDHSWSVIRLPSVRTSDSAGAGGDNPAKLLRDLEDLQPLCDHYSAFVKGSQKLKQVAKRPNYFWCSLRRATCVTSQVRCRYLIDSDWLRPLHFFL